MFDNALIELALGILALGGTGLLLVGGGYFIYSLIKNSKLKRLHKQNINEKKEALYYEEYIRKLDDDLRKEIDNVISDEKKKNINYEKIDSNYKKDITIDETDFANILKDKLHSILDKIEAKHINKIEEKYKNLNAKYHFDDSEKYLTKIKQLIIEKIDKTKNTL